MTIITLLYVNILEVSRKMVKTGQKKMEMKNANKKMKECLYNMRIKVDAAIEKHIHYSQVLNVQDISWKLISCIDENMVKIFKHIM